MPLTRFPIDLRGLAASRIPGYLGAPTGRNKSDERQFDTPGKFKMFQEVPRRRRSLERLAWAMWLAAITVAKVVSVFLSGAPKLYHPIKCTSL